MRQVLPGGVALFNQPDLSSADPALDLFLAGNCVTNVREPFEVDQPSDVVLVRKAGDEATLVLIHTPHDVVGDACVRNTRPTGHDGDAVAAHDLLQSCIHASRPASFFGAKAPHYASEGGSSPYFILFLILFYSSLVSGPVILSAAGAKDLLSAVPDARPDSSTVARVRSLTAGPSLARVPPHARSVRKQVLRSRAFRALAQDDSAAWRRGGQWMTSTAATACRTSYRVRPAPGRPARAFRGVALSDTTDHPDFAEPARGRALSRPSARPTAHPSRPPRPRGSSPAVG